MAAKENLRRTAAEVIRAEIARSGPVTFARFMELALYAPGCGYYERPREIGRRGDFFTSVSVGPVFGELLAFQFAQWLESLARIFHTSPHDWVEQATRLCRSATRRPEPGATGCGSDAEPLPSVPNHLPPGQWPGGTGGSPVPPKHYAMSGLAPPPAPWKVVEAGAHDGRLALDILRWLRQHRPDIFAALQYWIIEPSPVRRGWQEEKLGAEFPGVKWAGDLGAAALRPLRGIIFSNELLDAMPVHRLGWDAAGGRWLEWRVNWLENEFVWQRGPISREAGDCLPDIAPQVKAVLPDGFVMELSPAATQLWTRAAASLDGGKLLTLDYGFEGEEWLRPERANGTLRAFAGHRASGNLLANPGEQDITAHVNFAVLREAGEAAGLRTEGMVCQAQFLTGILQRSMTAPGSRDEWTPPRLRQFQTLTRPEHLGHRFRALLQTR